MYTRSDPNGSVSKLQRRDLAFTWSLTDPNYLYLLSAIRTQAVLLSKVIPLGFNSEKVSLKRVGSDPNWHGREVTQ